MKHLINLNLGFLCKEPILKEPFFKLTREICLIFIKYNDRHMEKRAGKSFKKHQHETTV